MGNDAEKKPTSFSRVPALLALLKRLLPYGLFSAVVLLYVEHQFNQMSEDFRSQLQAAEDLRTERERYIDVVEVASAEYLFIVSKLTPVNRPAGLPSELLDQLRENLLDQTILVANLRTALGEHEDADALIVRYQSSLDDARKALDSIQQKDPGELEPLLTATHSLHENRIAMVEGIRDLTLANP
ncbi:MAG: hypothetical protein AAGI44_07330 [Pseudomonadota bacterium]